MYPASDIQSLLENIQLPLKSRSILKWGPSLKNGEHPLNLQIGKIQPGILAWLQLQSEEAWAFSVVEFSGKAFTRNSNELYGICWLWHGAFLIHLMDLSSPYCVNTVTFCKWEEWNFSWDSPPTLGSRLQTSQELLGGWMKIKITRTEGSNGCDQSLSKICTGSPVKMKMERKKCFHKLAV